MSARRVVTGTTKAGRSCVAHDSFVESTTVAALPGYVWRRVWGFDALPEDSLRQDRADAIGQSELSHFPPPGGLRFSLFTIPPADTERPQLTDALRRELEEKLPGRAAHMESDQAGMHRTSSVDLIVILEGQVVLELDEGHVVLDVGDCVVQNATRHAWRNNTDAPCTMAIVLLGTEATA